MGSGRADIDTDADQLQIFLFLHVPVGIRERASWWGGHESPWFGFVSELASGVQRFFER
jgi:hypothetical protein